jgi:hypothetical protein
MSQPTQVFNTGLPDGGYSVVDNSAPGATVTSNGTPPNSNNWTGVGFDITSPGAVGQGVNTFKNGTVLLDSTTDAAVNTFDMATVVGNPVSNTPPTGKTVTTVINNATTGIRILFKNPS